MAGSSASVGGDEAAALVVVVLGAGALAVWMGAQLAGVVESGEWLDASVGDGFGAMLRLPAHVDEPAAAWPARIRPQVPGPGVYWPATAVCLFGLLGAMGWLWVRVFSWQVGTRRRERLGVRVGARFATVSDLRPLVVAGPTSGRFILGTVRGRLVATENRRLRSAGRRRRAGRRGDRYAVAVIGPSRSGKTANVVASVLDWDGPAVLSSVKDDLFATTVDRRRQLGEVFLFDPTGTITNAPEGVTLVGWSPLETAKSVPGAIEMAEALLDAAPSEGVTNASYWNSKGRALLWPILFAAAVSDATMADVVRWLALQDGNPDEGADGSGVTSRIVEVLATRAQSPDRRMALQAEHALAQFEGFFKLDSRTRSDVYSTSQTLVQPWEDPYMSYASSSAAGPVVDLRAVLSGANTLYVCQDLKSAQRHAVVYGGMLGSLLKDQAYEVSRRFEEPLPDLLVVIDEAGNTPLRWLPEVASTCAGIGVLLVTVWQSIAQIRSIYQAQAGPVLTNHGSKVIFAGVSDRETLDYVAQLGGEEEVRQRSANADAHLAGARRSVGDSTVHRKLLPAEVIRQAEPGNALLVHGTLPPAHLVGRRAWDDPRLSRMAEGRAPVRNRWTAPEGLVEALAFDRTPPLEVLEHLPGFASPTPQGRRSANERNRDRSSAD